MIAQRGSEGIPQPDLGRAARIDQRGVHYHLREMVKHEIVTKIPVCSNKAFTYLCILSRWLQDDEDNSNETLSAIDPDSLPEGTMLRPSRSVLKSRLVDLLRSAPASHRALSATELFRLSGLTPSRSSLRYTRQCVTQLVQAGCVEAVLTMSLGGPRHALYKYRAPYSAEADEDENESGEEDGEEEEDALSCWGPTALRPLISTERQAHDLIAASGSQGLVIRDLRLGLGISVKNAHRIGGRLAGTEKSKDRVIANSQVTSVVEHAGKERRYRFYIKDAEVDAPIVDTQISSVSSAPVSRVATPIRNRLGIVTAELRSRILAEIVDEQLAVDTSRSLALELGRRLALAAPSSDPKTLIDMRTIRRTLDGLVEAGRVRLMHFACPNRRNGTMQVAVTTSLPEDDQRLQTAIKRVKGRTRADEDEEEGEDDAQDTVVSGAHAVSMHTYQKGSEFRVRMQELGHVQGMMLRLRLLHQFLASHGSQQFDTLQLLYEELPLRLFLQITGLASVSAALDAELQRPEAMDRPMKDLPKGIYAEIMRRRGRQHRNGLRQLLGHLNSLGLVVPVEEGEEALRPGLRLAIPYSCRLAPLLHVTGPPDARTTHVLPLAQAPAYWDALEVAWTGADVDTIPFDSLPVVYALAVQPSQWLAVMKPAAADQIDAALKDTQTRRKRPISTTFILPGRSIDPTAQLAKRRKKKPTNLAIEWSAEETACLRLVYLLLQDRPRRPQGWDNIAWNRAEPLFPGKDGHALRVHVTKHLLGSWKEVKALCVMEKRLHLLKRLCGRDFGWETDADGIDLLPFEQQYAEIKSLITEPIHLALEGNGSLVLVYDLAPSRVMAQWHRLRHSRSTLRLAFEDTPFTITQRENPTDEPVPADLNSAMHAIKLVTTWPAERYSAEEGAMLLARHPESLILQAREALIGCGYLTLSSGGKHRYRVPGTGLALSSRVSTTLVTPQSTNVSRVISNSPLDAAMVMDLDINGLLDSALSGSITICVADDTEIRLQGSIRTPTIPSAEELEAILRSLGLWLCPLRSWFWPSNSDNADESSRFHSALLRNALSMVRALVEGEPGIPLSKIKSISAPLLTDDEIEDILVLLDRMAFIERSNQHIHPRLSL